MQGRSYAQIFNFWFLGFASFREAKHAALPPRSHCAMVSVESMVLAASFFALKNPGLARVENQKFRVCRVMSGSSGQVMLAVLVIESSPWVQPS